MGLFLKGETIVGLGKSKNYDPEKDPFKKYFNITTIQHSVDKFLRERKPWIFEDGDLEKALKSPNERRKHETNT